MKSSRPYRSRKIPACSQCRIKRSKCSVDTIGQSCHQCERLGLRCSSAVPRFSLRCTGVDQLRSEESHEDFAEPVGVHIVPPMIARDTQVLEDLLPSTEVNTPSTGPLKVNQQRAVYHTMIPPRRPSLIHCDCSKPLTLQLMKQVEPCLQGLVELYMVKLRPCLPLLAATDLMPMLTAKGQASRTFLLNFAAYVMFYWDDRPSLIKHPRPDQDFAWQMACAEMDSCSQSGGLPAIVSAILNIGGRPSKGVIHNMTSVARIVALANSIGLNHDCSEWEISDAAKLSRRNLWWAVLIHDRWFHFAQGTPPLVNTEHYDVAIPPVSTLDGITDLQSSHCYVALCELTEIVGDILPLVYRLRSETADIAIGSIYKSQSDLDAWLQKLPKCLDLSQVDTRSTIPGLVNLQLAYLSVRMLLSRLLWHELDSISGAQPERLLDDCRNAAENIVDFAVSLTVPELAGFWLPYNVQHFASAVTLLLRCALQTQDKVNRNRCLEKARRMVQCIHVYHNEHNWDLAEIALPQSERILSRIEEALPGIERFQDQYGLSDPDENQQPGLQSSSETINVDNSVDPWSDQINTTSLEELFPDIFSYVGDYALFSNTHFQDI